MSQNYYFRSPLHIDALRLSKDGKLLLKFFISEFTKFIENEYKHEFTIQHVESIKEENMDRIYDYLYDNFKLKFILPFPQVVYSNLYDCYYLDSEYRKVQIKSEISENNFRIYFTSYGGMCTRDDKHIKKRIHIIDNLGNEVLIPNNNHISLQFSKTHSNYLIVVPIYYNHQNTRNLI